MYPDLKWMLFMFSPLTTTKKRNEKNDTHTHTNTQKAQFNGWKEETSYHSGAIERVSI